MKHMVWVMVALGVVSGAAQAVPVLDQQEATQAKRLTPPGFAPANVKGGSTQAVAAAGPSFAPEAVYDRHCSICHAAGVAGAPKLGDAAAWSPRRDKGLETLVQHVVQGYNAMPAMGTCMACTEAHIHDAVVWMLDQ